jgi:hypothetical protein
VSTKKPRDVGIHDFVAQIKQLNLYLTYLPGPLNQQLGDEEVLAIIRRSVPHWNESLIRSAQSGTTLQALTTHYQDLEELEISRQHRNRQREAQLGNRNPRRARGERREHLYQRENNYTQEARGRENQVKSNKNNKKNNNTYHQTNNNQNYGNRHGGPYQNHNNSNRWKVK